ncbi:MAG: MoaD/ThiS family protein [Chloroflexota bacterium]|nr:MAG: MoaD/ThiS family protein [Chloroflexota bacterium]
MKVSFYASLRQAAGQKSIEVPYANGLTVAELLREILQAVPLLEREIMDDDGQLHEHIHILVNGRDLRYLQGGLDKTLAEEDQVSLFPAISGGV